MSRQGTDFLSGHDSRRAEPLLAILGHRVSPAEGKKIAFSAKASERSDSGAALNAIRA